MLIGENYNDNTFGREIQFYYLTVTIKEDKTTFNITAVPIKPPTKWKEFDMVDNKKKEIMTEDLIMIFDWDSHPTHYKIISQRMFIVSKDNLSIGKKKLLNMVYSEIEKEKEKNIDKIKSFTDKMNRDNNKLNMIKNSKLFRYKKLEELLGL